MAVLKYDYMYSGEKVSERLRFLRLSPGTSHFRLSFPYVRTVAREERNARLRPCSEEIRLMGCTKTSVQYTVDRSCRNMIPKA